MSLIKAESNTDEGLRGNLRIGLVVPLRLPDYLRIWHLLALRAGRSCCLGNNDSNMRDVHSSKSLARSLSFASTGADRNRRHVHRRLAAGRAAFPAYAQTGVTMSELSGVCVQSACGGLAEAQCRDPQARGPRAVRPSVSAGPRASGPALVSP